MKAEGRRLDRIAIWIAAAIVVCVSGGLGFGFFAIREWRQASVRLAEEHAEQATTLLVTALERDMRAVHALVLASAAPETFHRDPAFNSSRIVASALARYPYPETFFAIRNGLDAEELLFLFRADRPPAWSTPPASAEPEQLAIVEMRAPEVAQLILEAAKRDTQLGREYSVFDVTIRGKRHQGVARLLYGDVLRQEPDGAFGFLVDLAWARSHYFTEVAGEVSRIATAQRPLTFAIRDASGALVSGADTNPVNAPARSERRLGVMFFDPLLTAVDQPAALAPEEWVVHATVFDEPTLSRAVQAADRMIVIAGTAAATLALGLVLTIRAVRSEADLTEARSEFVATVTHELKMPITAIRLAGDTLLSDWVAASNTQRTYAQVVVKQSRRLQMLVDNLLALSKLTQPADAYVMESVAVDSLMEETLRAFAPQLNENGFQVQVDIPLDTSPVTADPRALSLVFDNLVDNAIRYSPDQRWLQIGARNIRQRVAIEIRDRGQGIGADELQHVTRKFVRGRNARQRGSGLGLAIVQRIIDDLGGTLEIESALGEGTIVRITLPAAREEA